MSSIIQFSVAKKCSVPAEDVATLRSEHHALAKKVEDLASLVAELQLELSTLRQGKVNRKVLILGDGNLSFSHAIASSEPETVFFATVFDSKDGFLKKYKAEDTLKELDKLPNVVLHFGVDATALPIRWASEFSTIIMNFPHPGGKTNLRKSKILLTGIFQSLRSIMDKKAEFRLSLAIGQSGIDKVEQEWIDILPTHNKDSWQAIYLGAEHGFVLKAVESFCPEKYQLYHSSGYKETKKGFNTREGLTLVFQTCENQKKTLFDFQNAGEKPKKALFHCYRPYYSQDLSFLFKCEEENGEFIALALVEELAGNCLARVSEVRELRTMCPDPYLPNRIYRIVWQGVLFPMGREMCARIHEELRCKIIERILADKLPLVLT